MDFISADVIVSFLTLTFLEIVLGIDNVVFISIIAGKAPPTKQKQVRTIGLAMAWVGRILLLLGINWVIGLNQILFTVADLSLTYRDLVLITGGLFLIGKSTSEIHSKIESKSGHHPKVKAISVRGVFFQIFLLDLVFSLDSIITAIGLVDEIVIIVAAISVAMVVMLIFAKRLSMFLDKHPAMKLLAISFLLMIGTVLVIEGLHIHVPKGYIYFAMAFAIVIEILNMKIRKVEGE
jgi:predicted tellurium resistance membrane protein TerC